MEKNVREKMLKEQDNLIYFYTNSYDEIVAIEDIDDEFDFGYNKLVDNVLKPNLDIKLCTFPSIS